MRHLVETWIVAEGERVERSLISRLCPEDEVSVHTTTLCDRRSGDRRATML